MAQPHVLKRTLTRGLASLIVLGLACEAEPLVEPNPDDTQLTGEMLAFEPVPIASFEQRLEQNAMRVEIELLEGELTAREVEIESDDKLADEEEIRSRISAVSASSTGGSLTLELGDLEVTFDGDSRFRVSGGDDLTMDEFVSRVDGALAGGVHPPVKVEREPSAAPQDPDDSSFHASELRLEQEIGDAEIEMNIDRDNLIRNDAPPPDGWIAVLGLRIALRVSEGITEIDVERPDVETVEFEGVVASVDVDAGAFTLEDGTLIKVVRRTELMESDVSHHQLRRLALVAEALNEGLTIVTFGKGAVESSDPLVLVAIRLAFGVDPATLEEFDGLVASVDLENRSVTLQDGRIIRTIGLTKFAHSDDWSLSDKVLQRVASALGEGVPIVVHGEGVAITDDEPQTLIAVKLKFGVQPPPHVDFEGVVAGVDLDANSFTLEDGTVVQIPVDRNVSDASPGSDRAISHRLRQLVEAMNLGLNVEAHGSGRLVGEDPTTILAKRVDFDLKADNAVDFSGNVAAADAAARTFTLDGGSIMRLIGLSETHFKINRPVSTDGRPDGYWGDPLELVERALNAGITVSAEGSAVPDPAEGSRGLVLKVVFEISLPPVESFSQQVVSVDPAMGSFELRDGTIVVWPAIAVAGTDGVTGTLRPNRLRALEQALAAGLVVFAEGEGVVTGTDPRVLTALWVKLKVDRTNAETFRGTVASVDTVAHTVTLEDGTVVQFLLLTHIEIGDGSFGLDILKRIANLLPDKTVLIKGIGLVDSTDPTTYVGIAVGFVVE